MTRRRVHNLIGAVLACATTSLLGCAASVEPVSVPINAGEAFSRSGTDAAPPRWWTAFGDDGLDAAVDSALSSNFDLRSAWERMRAARALARRESAALFPDVEASASTELMQTDDRRTDNVLLGLQASYEVDLWGRIGSAADAERLRAEATRADFHTAALSLSAETARTWYGVAEAQSQIELIDEQIQTNTDVLELIEARFAAGLVQSVDVIRQRQLVEATREQRTYAVSRLRVLKHRLAVLMGRSPIDEILADRGADALPDLPPLPETGLPMALVQRRPDVQSAFLSLQAADQDLATAIAERYPRLSLNASGTTGDARRLFDEWALSLAADLLVPIFYGGELDAEVDRVDAVRRQRLYEYGQSILLALQDVEYALVREAVQTESIQRLEQQVELAELAYQRLRSQYLSGAANYIDVLTALDESQQLRRSLLEAQLTVIEYRIALYRAIAGPFEAGQEREEL